jgi:hypothetical protein
MQLKQLLRSLFSPILGLFEGGNEPYEYKPSYRKILLVFALLFSGLAALVLWMMLSAGINEFGYFLPVLVFGGIGLLSLLIGLLGSDRAVSRLWYSTRGGDRR